MNREKRYFQGKLAGMREAKKFLDASAAGLITAETTSEAGRTLAANLQTISAILQLRIDDVITKIEKEDEEED